MSSFTTPADLRMLDDYRWELLAEFDYHVGSYPSDTVIRVPAGTVTDLASVPRLLWAVFPPHGRWAKAAIIHDYLYAQAIGRGNYGKKDGATVQGVGAPRAATSRRMILRSAEAPCCAHSVPEPITQEHRNGNCSMRSLR